jgi:ABC-2 type transport system ATP-binding protein
LHDYSIKTDGLTKIFNGKTVVEQFSLAVPRGSIYGLLGPNGAGKTTSIRMTLGIIQPDNGTSLLLGGHNPASVRHAVGYLPEERGLYANMKAREIIAFLGSLRGLPWAEGRRRGAGLMEEVGLGHAVDLKIKNMSKGMAQMVQLLGAIVHQPELIVLDEPFSGLDPINQGRLESLVLREQQRGATILFSTHVMAHAERLCDGISIIAKSRLRFEGTVDEARALLPMQTSYTPRVKDQLMDQQALLPEGAIWRGEKWHFSIVESQTESLIARLVASPYGIAGLSVDHPALHEAFVHIVKQADPSAQNIEEKAAP